MLKEILAEDEAFQALLRLLELRALELAPFDVEDETRDEFCEVLRADVVSVCEAFLQEEEA